MNKPATTRRLAILGSTGSIGRQTLDVVEQLNALHARGEHPVFYEIVALGARCNAQRLAEQASRFPGARTALAEQAQSLPAGLDPIIGADAAQRLVAQTQPDLVIGAMVGIAGLPATLDAIERGIDVALANKETLVAAGTIVTRAARASGARIIPIDSEHSGVWQCLMSRPATAQTPPFIAGDEVRKAIITASGGPFLDWPRDRMEHATVEDALAHPTWSMGPKVTIDSASMTNKALELIEAHWLFGLGNDRIGVLVEPTSFVHAIVEFTDGSSISQMGEPDMRTPIRVALAAPHRASDGGEAVCWASNPRIELRQPDEQRFPALALGRRVIEAGGTAGAIFNGANERAVEHFLDRKVGFTRISELSGAALENVGISEIRDVQDVYDAEEEARGFVDLAVGAVHLEK